MLHRDKDRIGLESLPEFCLNSSDGKPIDGHQIAQLVSAMAVFGAGANDTAASITEDKRAFLAKIGAADLWKSGIPEPAQVLSRR